MVRKFNDVIAKACAHLKLYKKAQALASKYHFSPQDHDVLEDIDQQLTKILTKTDQKLAKYLMSPWLPALHQAFLMHCFWTVSLSQARMRRDFLIALTKIKAQMQHPRPKPDPFLATSAKPKWIFERLKEKQLIDGRLTFKSF